MSKNSPHNTSTETKCASAESKISQDELDSILNANCPEDLPEHLQQIWVNREMAESDVKSNGDNGIFAKS